MIDLDVRCSKYLSLVKFSCNNSYQRSIDIASYEVVYAQKCRSHVY